MRALLDELYQEEAESKALAAIKKEEERAARMKAEILAANDFQKMIRHQRKLDQLKEEEEFRQRMMKKFEDDKQVEAMHAHRRRREIQNYRDQVEKLIEERRAQYEASRAAELAELAKQKADEKYRAEVVEKERQRLLAEHAFNLKEFLPKGVLRTASDFALVHGTSKPLPAASASKRTFGKRFNTLTIS